VTDNLGFSYQLSNGAVRFYVYMYFAEIEKLEADQTRQFDVFVNGALLQNNATLPFLGHGTLIYISSEPETVLQIWINRTNKATMSPILNGIELYKGKTLDLPQTHQNDGTYYITYILYLICYLLEILTYHNRFKPYFTRNKIKRNTSRCPNPYTNTSRRYLISYTESGQCQPVQHLTYKQSSDSTDF